MTPPEVLEADPGLIQALLEVIQCENAVRIMEEDMSKMNKSTYSILQEMGWGDSSDIPEELIDRPDERWLLG